jgi:hypothetical protein
LKVKLTGARHGQYLTDTVINADLIGSRVLIEDLRSAQWVQGVAASSSGPTLPLLFGLGAELSAEVTVRWPNGYETTDGPFPASQTAIIEDKGVPYVKDSTVQCVKTFGPGIVTFQFFWLGAGPATTAKVTLTHTPGSPGGDCYDYVAVLTPQSPDCAFNQVKQGTNQYTCSFFWNTQPCHPNCRFDYVIEADNGVAKSWSQTRTVRIASCIGG